MNYSLTVCLQLYHKAAHFYPSVSVLHLLRGQLSTARFSSSTKRKDIVVLPLHEYMAWAAGGNEQTGCHRTSKGHDETRDR
jgi:hypothetical protein